jgi:hypothetical protein
MFTSRRIIAPSYVSTKTGQAHRPPVALLTAYLLRLADIQEELKLFLFITFTANMTRRSPYRNRSISWQLYARNSVIFCFDIGEHHRHFFPSDAVHLALVTINRKIPLLD